MSSTRNQILNRLRQAQVKPLPVNNPDYPIWEETERHTMLARLVDLLQQNHAEVVTLKHSELISTLQRHIQRLGLKRVATGTGGEFHNEISQALTEHCEQLSFDKPFEYLKEELFNEV
ncbi:MAG: lactate utilization protein C, partial [Aeromonadales bacterium]|nr:lactate utilization protein C [Aeromonadales bacterium]